MLIGVLSDTHGHIPRTLEAAHLFESLEVDLVIHCGDIGAGEIVRILAPWPAHFVFGNCDDPDELVRAIDAAGQTCHDRFGSLELETKRIAFLHGDDYRRLEETVADGCWDLVCHGHTHHAKSARRGRTLVLNPGAVFRTSRPSVAAVRLPSLEVIDLPLQRR
jgi:hypothetical protein